MIPIKIGYFDFGLVWVFLVSRSSQGTRRFIYYLTYFWFRSGSYSFGFGLDSITRNRKIFRKKICSHFVSVMVWLLRVVRVIQVKSRIFWIKYRIIRMIQIKSRIFQIILDILKKTIWIFSYTFDQLVYFIIIQFSLNFFRYIKQIFQLQIYIFNYVIYIKLIYLYIWVFIRFSIRFPVRFSYLEYNKYNNCSGI